MRRILLNMMVAFSFVLPLMASSGVALACPSGSAGQVLQGIGETGSGCDSSGVSTVIGDVVSLLSIFVGVLAIIMIIVAGTKYISSGGDSNKVTNAKSTLIYALIGVAVAALAQFLVHFVLFKASQAGS